MKKTITAAVSIFLLCLLLIGVGVWNFNQPPVSLAKLKELKKGMSFSEVQQTIESKPDNVYQKTDENGQKYVEWCYTRTGAWSVVYIIFDSDDKYQEYDYDY